MRLIVAFLFFNLLSTGVTHSQTKSFVCNYYGKQVNETAICNTLGFRSRPEAISAVNQIVSRSGLKQNFYVMECPNIDNCFAAVRDGERLIVYDAAFMNKVNNLTKTDWGALSILAHEIGHHLQGHTLKEGGSDQTKEIEADEFSGFVMYQMGATLKEAQSAISRLTTDYDTGTHPPRSQRLGAIKRGYDNAKALYPSISNNYEKEEVRESEPSSSENTGNYENNENSVKKVGCINGNCINGYGIAVNKYTLEKYAGNWVNGKREGVGMEFYKNGSKKYEGNFIESTYEGRGRYYFVNGDMFNGSFKSGQMHGLNCVYYYKNGDRLYANYVNGQKQGKAKVLYSNGISQIVYFKNDKLIK